VQGYDNSSYGDAFADIYDEWYGRVSDVEATVDRLAAFVARVQSTDPESPPRPVLELGVGTGRLAIPLAARIAPAEVVGIDSSAAMLARLAANQATAPGNPVRAVLGDMADGLPDGPFGVVFAAFNTFFNLGTIERQQACFHAVAARLAPDGCFVLEADVPEQSAQTGSHVEVRSITADRVVLSVARFDAERNQAEGQFVEFTEAGGVRLRPWSIRSSSPAELDSMAAASGLVLRDRWQDFGGHPFGDDSDRHVSVYTRSESS
jgi:SAM-dependent methyltransferase